MTTRKPKKDSPKNQSGKLDSNNLLNLFSDSLWKIAEQSRTAASEARSAGNSYASGTFRVLAESCENLSERCLQNDRNRLK